ncbi:MULTISPECIES: nickel-dependent hydrogenase large subunit [Parabacteroides]|uniref:nickel-dependent hydrogenase large subunit n=1 Tax=Parabacteroides TaxID=375288 RepID=UPI000F0012B2|nr:MULTISPECIES: nickel-dependent hydrogenase large subunit [Parabacteroides]RHU31052.1 nickel-dependent hydrogenase large subunit [Parabacteroides sp. TM07-1AC]WFE84325.1 nickel-dependent hydrogenase large subunit [Parabacteroides chongii]
MSERIVIDPITRIEGHLRVEAAIEGGKIKEAYSSGTMVRGIENIVRNRDPRDAWVFVGRVCGVCTSIHSLCSVRAVEQALDITIPPNAEMVRNIMEAVLYMHDHTVHFYQLHALDWVDIVSALKADPKAAALLAQQLSPWAKNTEGYFRNTQERLKKFVASGQLGIFANGYWGHPAYKLTPEQNLIATVHYLDALEWQKEIVKVHAVFGGKNPHPNFLVGGMPCSIDLNEANAINSERLALVKQKLQEGKDFIDQVYIPDLLMIAEVYKDEWSKIGGGVSNYLSYGDFPLHGYAGIEDYLSPRGIVLDRDLSKVHPVDANSPEEIKEYIYHSWYKYTEGDKAGLHPYDGETNLEYTGPKPPYKHLDVEDKYSWIKTPRWKGQPMEVGPLARLIVAYAAGKEPQKTAVDNVLKQLNLPAEALFSTLGRTAARGIETQLVAGWSLEFFDQLMKNLENGDSRMANPVMWENENWPKKAQGVGLTEAPRGALAHFIVIENNRVKNYQMVVPTTWNASPRDENGNLSPYESALIGTPIHDANQPLEILRTIHSFDPCLACAVHLYDEEGKYVHQMDTF